MVLQPTTDLLGPEEDGGDDDDSSTNDEFDVAGGGRADVLLLDSGFRQRTVSSGSAVTDESLNVDENLSISLLKFSLLVLHY
ncbi:hypothetical protein M5689_010124 [Euphorbia peplus]|nr:hypothetical protein M5689_010124 [Euphorbia peplus]